MSGAAVTGAFVLAATGAYFLFLALMITIYVVLDGFDLGSARCTATSPAARRSVRRDHEPP
jgi:cytochrome bd-type quinol oxidase subunit 2